MFSFLKRKARQASGRAALPLSPELLRSVKELDIQATRRIAALLPGECRSAFRGSGMQFKEFRAYQPGDDIRHMAWTVTARTGKPTVRVYEEERELDILVLVDVSGSTLSGVRGKSKREMYAELVMLLGLSAIKGGDNFGMLYFHEKPELYMPPKGARNQVLNGVSKLLAQPLEMRQSDIRPALRYAGSVLKHRSLVIILSDFIFPHFEEELRALTASHEVVLLQCFHDLERGHTQGVYEARDPESGSFFLLDANSRRTRKLLTHAQMDHCAEIENLSRRNGTSFLQLSLQDDYFKRLITFFRHRGVATL